MRDRDHVRRVDREPFDPGCAALLPRGGEKPTRLCRVASGIEGPAALEQVAYFRSRARRAELRLDFVEQAMRLVEALAQRIGARDLSHQLEPFISASTRKRRAKA